MFTEEDRTAALVWQSEQAGLCPGCGHPRDESMDPANEEDYTARKLACHACAARDRAAGNGENAGHYWSVVKD